VKVFLSDSPEPAKKELRECISIDAFLERSKVLSAPLGRIGSLDGGVPLHPVRQHLVVEVGGKTIQEGMHAGCKP
jgi:hypothetical protein